MVWNHTSSIVFSILTILIVSFSSSLAASDAPAKIEIPWLLKVLSGDNIRYNYKNYKIVGVNCPSLDTEEGIEAKRLANSYLHSGAVQVTTFSCDFCEELGRIKCKRDTARASLSEFLINSGLCKGE